MEDSQKQAKSTIIGGFSVKFAVLNGYSNILGVPRQLIFRDYRETFVSLLLCVFA